ncbi:hypothetical protein [Streptomyces sp. NBC_01518]|uniref:hypothetical protein n=1 Tax=Streptomyces sp. NBC_01518 TaxID=2903891 RepID=UPI003866F88F
MDDDEIRACYDGRGRVELLPGRATAAHRRRAEEIARALGYRLLAVENLGRAGVRLLYERDDGPRARRRAELTIARLRAGGPTASEVEQPPPPPLAALPARRRVPPLRHFRRPLRPRPPSVRNR